MELGERVKVDIAQRTKLQQRPLERSITTRQWPKTLL